jgi:DNA-binding response OmpR family regulator
MSAFRSTLHERKPVRPLRTWWACALGRRGGVSGMPRILVVEDDALIGALLAEMLADKDVDVCAVEKTRSGAVEAALRLRPDLMIVDLRLGRDSGFAVMEDIERVGQVPHIFMSGENMPCGTRDAPILVKPFTWQQLSAAIGLLLRVAVS